MRTIALLAALLAAAASTDAEAVARPAAQEAPPAGAPPKETPQEAPKETPAATDATSSQEPLPVLALRASRVFVAPGEVLENATVVVRNGRIVAVGSDVEVPEGARVLEGAVLCAGFIDPWSQLGIEPRSVEDSRTDGATRATDALDPWSFDHERRAAAEAGVLLTRVMAGDPADVGGLNAVVRTARGAGELVVLSDAAVNASVGIGDRGRNKDPFDRVGDADRIAGKLDAGAEYSKSWAEYRKALAEWEKAKAEELKTLEKDFKKAQKAREKALETAKEKGETHEDKKYKDEHKKPREPKYDAEKEVLARVVDGELPLVVRCEGLAELRALLTATASHSRLRLAIAGGSGADLAAADLVARRIPVIVRPVPFGDTDGSRPEGNDLGLAARLARRGVEVLIGTGSATSRELPLLASLAVGHGLDREAAFEALTSGAARLFDLSGEYGTVRVGKRAELLLLDGDPLASGSRVRAAVSAGRVVVEAQNP